MLKVAEFACDLHLHLNTYSHYISDNSADLYNLVKFLAYTKFGVQTQCIVKGRKFADAQTRSNIALKVNAKLFSHLNHAHAWDTAIPWINEVPTLVIGFSMSAGKQGYG